MKSVSEIAKAWGEAWYTMWVERAGIIEHDGGVPRHRAEIQALVIVQRALTAAGAPCARCGGPRGDVAKAGGSIVCEACGAASGELTDGAA